MTARQMILVCLASAAWAFSFGAGTQATTHWLNDEGASESLIGQCHACYYLGVAITEETRPVWPALNRNKRSARHHPPR